MENLYVELTTFDADGLPLETRTLWEGQDYEEAQEFSAFTGAHGFAYGLFRQFRNHRGELHGLHASGRSFLLLITDEHGETWYSRTSEELASTRKK